VQGRQAMLEKGDRKETVTLPVPGDTTAGGAPPGGPAGAPPGAPAMPGAPMMPENARRSARH
jgi:hypothetical protein